VGIRAYNVFVEVDIVLAIDCYFLLMRFVGQIPTILKLQRWQEHRRHLLNYFESLYLPTFIRHKHASI